MNNTVMPDNLTIEEIRKCFREGVKACRQGKTVDASPYGNINWNPLSLKRHQEWYRGYIAAKGARNGAEMMALYPAHSRVITD
jgi:hypothetical protein